MVVINGQTGVVFAEIGAIFYIIVDISIHWGVFRHIRKEINTNGFVLLTAIIMDVVALSAFLVIKAQTDMLVIYSAIVGLALVFLGERLFLNYRHSST